MPSLRRGGSQSRIMKLGEGEKTRDLGPVAKSGAAGLPDETGMAPRSEGSLSVVPKRLDPLDASIWPVIDGCRYSVAGEHARGGLGRILEAADRRLDRP